MLFKSRYKPELGEMVKAYGILTIGQILTGTYRILTKVGL